MPFGAAQQYNRIFITLLFTIIIASWLYLFIISFKSYLLIPMIDPKQEKTKFLSSSFSLIKESTTITSINDNIHYFSRKKRFTNDPSIYPFVSVIVPARNEQDHIKRCLYPYLLRIILILK
jgi:hypothetical protein